MLPLPCKFMVWLPSFPRWWVLYQVSFWFSSERRRFNFQHSSYRNKGKSSSSNFWNTRVNACFVTRAVKKNYQRSGTFVHFFIHCNCKNSHKFDISVNLNFRFLTRNEEKSVFGPWKWQVSSYMSKYRICTIYKC